MKPYYFTFSTHAKGRWVGSKVIDVFCKEFQSETPEYYVSPTEVVYCIMGKFDVLYLANEPFERNWRSGVATTALTLHPPENFNLVIYGQIRQIAKLKLPPNFCTSHLHRPLEKKACY